MYLFLMRFLDLLICIRYMYYVVGVKIQVSEYGLNSVSELRTYVGAARRA